uniref:SCP domain-containing protein n=1 Tax=Strongyloides venezuelensis TaxID=75913 RepID=A0A0K0FIY3_STRVS
MQMYIILVSYVISTSLVGYISAQLLAVAYMTMTMGRNNYYYSYRDSFYYSFEAMAKEIYHDHRLILPRNLLAVKVSHLQYGHNQIVINPKCQKLTGFLYDKQLPGNLIIEYYINGSELYKCYGKTFNRYGTALTYSLFYRIKKHSFTRPITSIDISKQKISCLNFWMYLWKNCHYEYYSKHNFKIMKEKFLLELNYYRFRHGSKVLFEDPRLSRFAERSLERLILRAGRLDPTKHENVAKASLELAPLMINSWYGERKNYDYKSKHGNLNAKHFTAMVWKNTKAVGFGIVKVGHSIYLKVVYDTLTNLPHMFRKNVHKKVKRKKYWKKY